MGNSPAVVVVRRSPSGDAGQAIHFIDSPDHLSRII
jgi:hypothetical protein